MNKTYRTLWMSFTLAILAMSAGHAMAVEEPAFKRVKTDGAFEVRDYPGLIAAEAHVEGERQPAINQGFRLIADYIFGNNRQKAKVAMTAPVTQSADSGQKIAMTAPVTQSGDGQRWTVRFIMPSSYTLATLPEPNNSRVTLVPLPPQRFAVVRFSGLASEADITTQTQKLVSWMKSQNLIAQGPPTLARYDPPWTLWFMRRNEILIPVSNP
jgi:hypothetical protein